MQETPLWLWWIQTIGSILGTVAFALAVGEKLVKPFVTILLRGREQLHVLREWISWQKVRPRCRVIKCESLKISKPRNEYVGSVELSLEFESRDKYYPTYIYADILLTIYCRRHIGKNYLLFFRSDGKDVLEPGGTLVKNFKIEMPLMPVETARPQFGKSVKASITVEGIRPSAAYRARLIRMGKIKLDILWLP